MAAYASISGEIECELVLDSQPFEYFSERFHDVRWHMIEDGDLIQPEELSKQSQGVY
ncbi:MAG: hypothetical protein KC994_25425 [Candidatus Omnitrophica bacterium]|nr:hypothetical protein [Candidatus Omnitrophota bacterium]